MWKFQHVRVESHFWTSFEEGWARMPFMQRRLQSFAGFAVLPHTPLHFLEVLSAGIEYAQDVGLTCSSLI